MEDLTGKQLGQYQVVEKLDEGGMVTVYKAFQPSMERYVTLKILPRHDQYASAGKTLPDRGLKLLLPSTAYVAKSQIYISHYELTPAETLLTRLISLTGDANLYAWDLEGVFIEPSDDSLPVEEVNITATLGGIYQLEVEGYTSANFRLEINPSTILTTSEVSAFDIDNPIIRGRGTPLTVSVPDKDIGLPDPPELRVFLPVVVR